MNHLKLAFLVGLISLGIAPSGFATATTVARVRSGPCSGNVPASREGSAVLFQREGKTFALTAGGLPFDSRDGAKFCADLTLPGGSPSAAKVLATDWGNDLALLEWPGVAPLGEWPTAEQLTAEPSRDGDTVSIRGEAMASDSTGGSILSSPTSRQSFAQAGYVIEVQGAIVPSTAVGGAVIGSDGGFIGIVSSEFLKMVPGTPTRPHDWDFDPAHTEPYLLVLDNRMIAPWLAAYFAQGPGFAVALRRYAEDQDPQHQTVRVTGNGLTFQSVCPPEGLPPTTSGEFRIGGGNGVGSGGGSGTVLACEITLTASADPVSAFPIPGRAAWGKQVHGYLASAPAVTVPLIYQRDPDTQALTHRVFLALGEFFQDLALGDWEPATLIPSTVTASALKKLGDAARLAAAKQYADLPIDDEKLRQLMRQTFLVATLAESETPQTVGRADIDPLLDPNGVYSFEWRVLQNPFPSDNYHVRDALTALQGGVR